MAYRSTCYLLYASNLPSENQVQFCVNSTVHVFSVQISLFFQFLFPGVPVIDFYLFITFKNFSLNSWSRDKIAQISRVGIKKPTQKNPPKKTQKNPPKKTH